jgi:hypothetical protein
MNSFRTVVGDSWALINSVLHNSLPLATDSSLETHSIWHVTINSSVYATPQNVSSS